VDQNKSFIFSSQREEKKRRREEEKKRKKEEEKRTNKMNVTSLDFEHLVLFLHREVFPRMIFINIL